MVTTERAIDAALAAARRAGLPDSEPRVLRDVTNVLVHLAPAPVVARVSITLACLRDPGWFAQELRLAAFLAEAGAPVAPPAAGLDPGPHVVDGLSVGFWAFVGHDPDRADPAAAGRSLAELHAALERFPEPLPRCERFDEIGRLLDVLRPSEVASADDLAALRVTYEALRSNRLPGDRTLHGDAHLGNVLWTADGPLWSDLENACVGPVEWDLACMAWRAAPGTPEAIAAYGAHDPDRVQAALPFLALFLATWTITIAERVPTESGGAEARRRIERATAYAREM
jgi:aminoglycoside phosphotransferase (APT) family kinase protein